MASINEKLNYINETKSLIKDKLNDLGSEIENETTFREYAEKIEDLYDEWPKINDEDTTVTLNSTKKGKMNLQLKGNTNQFTTTGKNWLPLNWLVDKTVSGVEITNLNNGTLKLNGTSTAGINLEYSYDLQLNANEEYNWINYNIFKSSNINISLRDVNLNAVTYIPLNSNNKTFTPQDSIQIKKIRIRIESGTTFSNYIIKAMFIKGNDTNTQWEPYTGKIASPNPDYPQNIEVVTGENLITISNNNNTENQTFNINLGEIKLYKIKNTDIQDYILEDNNKWYKKKIIGEAILTGEEEWTYYQPALVFFTDAHNDMFNTGVTHNTDIYSNYYIAGSYNLTNNVISINSIGRIHIRNDNINTETNFKTWLSTHNTSVLAKLGTPVFEEITDTTLITQLNTLKQAMSYNNQTNISQTNNNLPFVISASALLKNSN